MYTHYPRTVKRESYAYQGRPVTLDAAELEPGHYEIMLLTDDGKSLSETTARTEDAALCEFRWIRSSHRPDAETPKLTGKYLLLRDHLLAAHQAAEEASQRVEDTGTCNFDSPALDLPRWRVSLVEEAARQAGVGCFTWSCFGHKLFVFPMHTPGQARKREVAQESAMAVLRALGYDTYGYYQMD